MWGRGVRQLAVLTAVMCGLMVIFTGVGEALTLYDDFVGPLINPAKWRGQETFTAGDNPNAEAQRYIVGGKLRVFLRTYGAAFTNTGAQSGRFGLKIPNPELVTAMATTVTVVSASTQACATNTGTTTRAQALMHGYFFNDGSSLRIGDGTGDINAGIALRRTDTGLNQVAAFINRCSDWDCFSSTTLTSIVFAPTTWALNVPVTLVMTWETANNRFVFKATPSGGPPETRILSYAGLVPGDTDPPQDIDVKRIILDHRAANCASGRKQAVMDVRFDNFMTTP